VNTPPTPGTAAAAHCPSAVPGINPLAPLPRLGEVIRDAEVLGAQLLAVLSRDVDPASEPDLLAWPEVNAEVLVHRLWLAHAVAGVEHALRRLAAVSTLPVGAPVKTTRLDTGEEPTPGSAVALGGAARESTGAVVAPGAGANSGPSPRRAITEPYGTGVRRGAGPGVLGPS